MQDPNALVSTVIRFEPPLDRPAAEMLRAEGGLSVELEGGRRVRLDPGDARSLGFAQILDGLSKQRLPVYVEIDPETSGIRRLLIPYVARVVGIRPNRDETLAVELEPSHALHVLRSGTPDFAELEQHLREALRTGEPVIVTEDDAHQIIGVRDYTPPPDAPSPLLPKREQQPPRKSSLWRWLRRLGSGSPTGRAGSRDE